MLVGNDVQDYLLEIIEATRNHELIEIGVSPRGTLAFMKAIQARAILNERVTVRQMILRRSLHQFVLIV